MKKDINQGYVQETNNVPVTLDKNGYLESGRNELKENFEISLKEIKKRSEKLTGKRKKNLILKFLKENYVEIEENVEYLGYKGRIIHVNIPQAGGFSGFNFDFFVSDDPVSKDEFEENSKLEKKSYSEIDVSELLNDMDGYMFYMNLEVDMRVDYEYDLWRCELFGENYKTKAGEFLKNLAGLDYKYWISDKPSKENRTVLDCRDGCGFFSIGGGDIGAKLLLRLSEEKAEVDETTAEKEETEAVPNVHEGEVEGKDKAVYTKEELYGNKEKVLKNLKENYVEIEENVEYLGYKGKNVHIELPAVGEDFGGFRFEYFISDVRVFKRDFGSNEKLCEKSYLVKNIIELLKATNAYLKAMGIEADGDMDYENGLRYWENGNNGCKAGEFLKNLAGLDVRCWLKDIKVEGDEEFVSMWFLVGECCYFCWGSRPFLDGNLFLRLSD